MPAVSHKSTLVASGISPSPTNWGDGNYSSTCLPRMVFSANDRVDPELCSLRYITVDDAVAGILHLGCSSLLAKVDIEAVFRIIPVHP